MTNTPLQPARRVLDNPPYAFATISKEINALIAAGRDVIRLDIGNPDMPPAPPIIETLVEYSRAADTHGYAGYAGIPALRAAMAGYYRERFGVTLDPDKEIIPLIGSKEGIANIHLAWLDPGDLVLVPDPGYMAYAGGPQLAGGEVESFPLLAENGWLPDFEMIPAETARRARLLWLNYPNNPTGAVADLAFFERAIDFCRRHRILLCHDNPYADTTFDGYRAPSPLQIPGAKEVVIEFNSLSKTYNMAGWRVGMAVGSAVAVQALASIKTQIDSGFARPVQQMAIAALTGDQSWIAERNRIYQERRDLVIRTLADLDIAVPTPKATFYIWFQAPAGYTDLAFYRKLLDEAAISVAPGNIYGRYGEGWMRLSIGTPTARLETAMERLKAVRW